MATVIPVVTLDAVRVVCWRWVPEPGSTKPWWAPEVYVVEDREGERWVSVAMVTRSRTDVRDVDRAMAAIMRVVLALAAPGQGR